MFELRPISSEAIPVAMEKAERYRLLNEPREAASICRDILETDPDHTDAQVCLLLALTDQFGEGLRVNVNHAMELVERLPEGFLRKYYEGVVAERWAKCQLAQKSPGHVVFEWLRHAMECYEEAQPLSPKGHEEAILRWNTCVRIMRAFPDVRPRPEDHHDETSAGFEDEVPWR
ncbi:MAG: hypothetical protein ACYTGC_03125 [Planctomycetota bacterium]|jgi:hypothetical protein